MCSTRNKSTACPLTWTREFNCNPRIPGPCGEMDRKEEEYVGRSSRWMDGWTDRLSVDGSSISVISSDDVMSVCQRAFLDAG